ncbi:MAG: hypothetical protein ACK5MY_02240 [Jhaorihella sp.]
MPERITNYELPSSALADLTTVKSLILIIFYGASAYILGSISVLLGGLISDISNGSIASLRREHLIFKTGNSLLAEKYKNLASQAEIVGGALGSLAIMSAIIISFQSLGLTSPKADLTDPTILRLTLVVLIVYAALIGLLLNIRKTIINIDKLLEEITPHESQPRDI